MDLDVELDFIKRVVKYNKGVVEIYPGFILVDPKTLLIRGQDFYAVYLGDKSGMWSTNEQDLIRLIDAQTDKYAEEYKSEHPESVVRAMHMQDTDTGIIDKWRKYCTKQMRDNSHKKTLDQKLIFQNTEVKRDDYASKRLPYDLSEAPIPAYEQVMNTLYSPQERHKWEWSIGSIISGDSKKNQKFLVAYGPGGTGKSTVLDIIDAMFHEYSASFDAKSLATLGNAFAMEQFKNSPLVAIQHDGDLSKIEDNTRLNSIISHEPITVNEKFKAQYVTKIKAFLFMGTNTPVKITDAKSGMIRRLIDVSPTGNKIPYQEYRRLIKQIRFELGGIAWHCLQVYKEDPNYYDDYIPVSMIGASNDFYNFIVDGYFKLKEQENITLSEAYERYKDYCERSNTFKMNRRVFGEELKNYYREFHDRYTMEDGTRVRSYYVGFLYDKFSNEGKSKKEQPKPAVLTFDRSESLFDKLYSNMPAQYANVLEKTPTMSWDKVKTTLGQLDTSKVHYVKVPENLIVIDFDIKGKDGTKSFMENLEAASKWPPTYAELSQSGQAIHLHYIYDGDVSKLSTRYGEDIEIKVFRGNSSLRRRVTKCNGLPIATISSGLPLKEEKVIQKSDIASDQHLHNTIKKIIFNSVKSNPDRKYSTAESIQYIAKILDEAYDKGYIYDVTDLADDIKQHCMSSSHQMNNCLRLFKKMKLQSKREMKPETKTSKLGYAFFDIEVFPNLFLINWKPLGTKKCFRLINPKPEQIEEMMQYDLIGFNNLRYDNIIVYAAWALGYSVEELYYLSQRIINGERLQDMYAARNLSYTDVYDFAATKQSLKKWETTLRNLKKQYIREGKYEKWMDIEIKHHELGFDWNQPVPEDKWEEVAVYCDDDVFATEAVFLYLEGDFKARCILADIAGMTPNTPTNTLTTKIIFGDASEKEVKQHLVYRDMSDQTQIDMPLTLEMRSHLDLAYPEFCVFNHEGRPIFPGYIFDSGKSTYRGIETGEGGEVYAEPGMATDVALLDIASMHPSSAENENAFGKYTKNFSDIKFARICIKHKELDKAKELFGGKLIPYLDDPSQAKDLAQALKIAINSVYGLTSAKFSNHFRHPDNRDNFIAKRGALFMVNLMYEVQAKGFQVLHIKTDSIKIPNATPEIIKFVNDYGALYGYVFEHEATYDKICLVNNAVYICKHDGKWDATGKQFQVPYVFKTLFSKEPVYFEDKCVSFSVQTSLHVNRGSEDIPDYAFVGKVGEFCPMRSGTPYAGPLLRKASGDIEKYSSATGAKGYIWLESDIVEAKGLEDQIDLSYFNRLCDEAVEECSKYGDFEWFVS